MKIFVSIPMESQVFETFIPSGVQKKLEENFDVKYFPGSEMITVEEFVDNSKDCDVVITGWGHPQITSEMLSGTQVKLIAHTGGSVGSLTGPDVFDFGVKVISGNLMYAESVAEGVIAYILMGLRKIPHYVNNVRNGGWHLGAEYNTKGLLGETIGLVGFGTITKFLIEMLQAFRVKIMLYTSYPPDDEYCKKYNIEVSSLDEIFEKCKIVSLHSAMTERTRGLVGKKQFDLLQDGSLFINTSRGRVVNEEEMVEALKDGRFNAVLDVFYNEPLSLSCPLRTLDNVYSIPHLAGPTMDRRPLISSSIIDNILAFEKGESMKLEIAKDVAARMTVGG